MNMKVALVALGFRKIRMATSTAPANLAILGSYIRETTGCEVKVIDGIIGQDVEKGVREYSPDIIGVSSTTPQALPSYGFLDRLGREFGQSCFRVMGGVHPTLAPEEASAHCDAVVVGEGEIALAEIIRSRASGQPIPRIIQGTPVKYLDDLPLPAWDLIDVEAYMNTGDNPSIRPYSDPNEERIVSLITSRGCPKRCAFCWNSYRALPPRYRSARKVVEEVEYLRDKYRTNTIWFAEDEFPVNRPRLRELHTLFKERGLDKLAYGCQARADTCDLPTLKMLKEMGFRCISVGFESGNERILNMLKSGSSTVAINAQALKNAAEVNISMFGSFIMGSPTETREEMLDTLRFIESHDQLYFAGINILIPYPKTAIWDMCKAEGMIPGSLTYNDLVPAVTKDGIRRICGATNRAHLAGFIIGNIRIARAATLFNIAAHADSRSQRLANLSHFAKTRLFWYMCARHPRRVCSNFSRKIWKGELRA